ncbi:MAG: hypothetical protein JPMHGGIA_01411 [Saprospiraceae bacterium]|nr:hypothetical protein [Saprospiraceae bacterium]
MAEPLILPVFPLPIVVFPDEEVRLHIFEPRYKQLVIDCLEMKITFGLMPIIENRLMKIGTVVRLESVERFYDDGRSDIHLQSLDRFRMIRPIENLPDKLYSFAEIEHWEKKITSEHPLAAKVLSQFNELCEINKVRPFRKIDPLKFRSYDLGHFVGFNLQQEYAFFSLETEVERLEMLQLQIEFMLEQTKVRDHWLRQLHMNGEYRNFKPGEWK